MSNLNGGVKTFANYKSNFQGLCFNSLLFALYVFDSLYTKVDPLRTNKDDFIISIQLRELVRK